MTPAIGVAVAIVAVALALPAGAAAAIPCGNIVVNGGADAGGPSGTDIAAPAGWQATGEFDAVAYGSPDGPPRPAPASGANYFWGGRAALSSGSERIDLSSAAAEIGAGGVTAQLEADLGGFQDQADSAGVDLAWVDAQGVEVGGLRLDPAGPVERGNRTELIHRVVTGSVPATAVAVRVTVTMTRLGGTDNDGYADDVSLVLGPQPASCNTPPPKSVTQPRGSCGNAPGEQVCIGAPPDILKFGCVRAGRFVHRFGVKLKKRQGGLIVNRRSRVRVAVFSLDGRANGSDRRRPYFADVDGTALSPGAHQLAAAVYMAVPRTRRPFVKRLRFAFRTCA